MCVTRRRSPTNRECHIPFSFGKVMAVAAAVIATGLASAIPTNAAAPAIAVQTTQVALS